MRIPFTALLAVVAITLASASQASECSEYASVYKDKDGKVTRIVLRCDNCFEGATPCGMQREKVDGEVRLYCTCAKKAPGTPESPKCHLVLFNPDGEHGKPSTLRCSGNECVSPTVCLPQPKAIPNTQQPLPNGGSVEKVRCPCQTP